MISGANYRPITCLQDTSLRLLWVRTYYEQGEEVIILSYQEFRFTNIILEGTYSIHLESKYKWRLIVKHPKVKALFSMAIQNASSSITTILYQRNPCNWASSRLRWEQ